MNVFTTRWSKTQHADGKRIPSSSHAGGVRLAVLQLGVCRLGESARFQLHYLVIVVKVPPVRTRPLMSQAFLRQCTPRCLHHRFASLHTSISLAFRPFPSARAPHEGQGRQAGNPERHQDVEGPRPAEAARRSQRQGTAQSDRLAAAFLTGIPVGHGRQKEGAAPHVHQGGGRVYALKA
jgi:hypothetical protein